MSAAGASAVPCEHQPLPLPLGEVAERSEVGEGKQKIQLRTPFPVFYEYIPRTGKNCFV